MSEKETPFNPVPYETNEVSTSIILLSSLEVNIVLRALSILAKYADGSDLNINILYKYGIIPKLLELTTYSDLTIMRFSLKLLGQLVTICPEAANELSLENYYQHVKQISFLFNSTTDNFVREFSVQFLSQVIRNAAIASFLLRFGITTSIFTVLNSSQDGDTQLYTLLLFKNILKAPEAPQVLAFVPEFSAKTLLCYLKNQLSVIRCTALDIIEILCKWKSSRIQDLFREVCVVETLLKILMDNSVEELHKKSLDIVVICIECVETATYFVRSIEFLEFCLWAKTCPKKFILQSAIILTSLTHHSGLRQILFDFSVEDTILLFFRINSEFVFYKVCESILNLSLHRFCCQKIVTPVVIYSIISMLRRENVSIVPFHEIALKTILTLLKRNIKTIDYIYDCKGIDSLSNCLLNKDQYTDNGIATIMYILYIFSNNLKYKLVIMNDLLFKKVLDVLEESSDFSHTALLIIEQYTDNKDYRQYFIEFNGPVIILEILVTTPNQQLFYNILVFLRRILMYKTMAMEFLWRNCVQKLESFTDKLKEAYPLINTLINTIYDLYLPLKFHKLGRIEITDHFSDRFYLINAPNQDEFVFLEIMEDLHVSFIHTIYVVDFSANVSALLRAKLVTPTKTPTTISTAKLESEQSVLEIDVEPNYMTCRVPPPINYGSLSEDPYLPQFIKKLKSLLFENKNYILCFQHQVATLAKFVNDSLSGLPYAGTTLIKQHNFKVHISTLKEKLGTSLIPLGFLRHGFSCERSLLFKALADKIGIPATLVRGKIRGKNNLFYWNEVPLTAEEPYENLNDELQKHVIFAVVDLMKNIGNLMFVGSVEANKYCGLS